MKKTITFAILVFFVSIITHNVALAQTFSSVAEIDAYYDAQSKQLDLDLKIKNKAVDDQLSRDLERISLETEAGKIQISKELWGKEYETVKPFLSENNPDPEQIAAKYLPVGLPKEMSLNFIKFIGVVNPDLGNKVSAIYQKRSNTKTPSAMEIFTYFDSSNINWITAANQFETLKTTNFSLYYDVLMIAETKYFKGYTPETLFVYLESLSEKEVSAYTTKLKIFSPNLLELAYRIARVKYPNGKEYGDGAAKTTTPKPSVTPTTVPSLKPSPKVEKKVVTVSTSNTTATSVQATSEIKQDAPTNSTTQQATEVKPEKKSFIQKTSDFFKKIIFWR